MWGGLFTPLLLKKSIYLEKNMVLSFSLDAASLYCTCTHTHTHTHTLVLLFQVSHDTFQATFGSCEFLQNLHSTSVKSNLCFSSFNKQSASNIASHLIKDGTSDGIKPRGKAEWRAVSLNHI